MSKKDAKVQEFLNKIVGLCEQYQLSLAHEDSQGAFIIEKFSEENIKWLLDPFDHSDR